MAVLDVQNLTLSFGERTLFAGVSFSIKEREKVGFVGANGVGKTSLFKVICGDYTPDSGGAFLSKNCKLGYMEQHTCSAGNTVWNELVSVVAPLMELERQLEEVGDRLRSGQGDTAADIALQDRLTEQFQREEVLERMRHSRLRRVECRTGDDALQRFRNFWLHVASSL